LSDPRYEQSPTYPLDNELRTYLGVSRLRIGDEDEAAVRYYQFFEVVNTR